SYSNETKQPITDKLSAIGCLKGVLIPVSKTGVSPVPRLVCFFIHSCNDMKQGTDTVHQDRKEIRNF
ncbi:hypothetical protein P9160_21535, partial [Bacillus halotolerans]|uniref:hypothetical protein n=1 Tax=Bacillus halotolerans TaxID=260554 RepID=UPI002DBE5776